MRERELKLVVGEDFVVPRLDGVIPGATLGPRRRRCTEDTYFDTADLRLARWGVTLRCRAGVGWTVKIPHPGDALAVLDRDEIAIDGDSGEPPEEAHRLVAAFARGEPLVEVARVANDLTARTWRRSYGTVVAELVDGHVTATTDGTEVCFREIEVELAPEESADILDALLVAMALEAPGGAVAKLVRVLGGRASAAPDVVVPALGEDPTAAEVMHAAIATSVTQLLSHVPAAYLGVDPEGVHQARVATRRLRSDLRTFGPLLDATWARRLRRELRWLADELGRVRDADVLHATLRSALDRESDIGVESARSLLEGLRSQRDRDRGMLVGHLGDARAIVLFEHLVEAACAPKTLPAADRRARKVMPRLVSRCWRDLRRAVSALSDGPSDSELHQIRILAKRVRYATEAVMPAAGKQAARFAAAAASIQDDLGDLNDAAVAEGWLQTAAGELADPAAVAARRLAGDIVAEARADRRRWAKAYKKMQRHSSWLAPR